MDNEDITFSKRPNLGVFLNGSEREMWENGWNHIQIVLVTKSRHRNAIGERIVEGMESSTLTTRCAAAMTCCLDLGCCFRGNTWKRYSPTHIPHGNFQ